MTTCLALVDGARVHMVADSQTNIYDRPVRGWLNKIMRLPVAAGEDSGAAGEVLLGISGAAAAVGRIRATWDTPVAAPWEAAERQQWADDLASRLTVMFLEHSLVEQGVMDGHLLLAVAGHPGRGLPGSVWTVNHHMAAPCVDGRAAVGSGEGPAMGAMEALIGGELPAAQIAVAAAHIAVRLDRWSGTPLQVEVLEPAS